MRAKRNPKILKVCSKNPLFTPFIANMATKRIIIISIQFILMEKCTLSWDSFECDQAKLPCNQLLLFEMLGTGIGMEHPLLRYVESLPYFQRFTDSIFCLTLSLPFIKHKIYQNISFNTNYGALQN
ncbi:MAG: hypothetical protein UU23_C0003G0004 [Candidatus Curtissbacteria bacterium GW2011_GWA1_40_9]|uniref:Uncharacterized protein n=1 Tax=Candidatus Curtissbacteria bacterium GW2011_GWA1_40_9 TaxID=1618408 RepID=A0A0G0TTE1_9BACT|nr:MAG: hypothetical protein UU23_C0003G0004 [Candidatus Curtissbacteria bacterium GW2011_GWA1_40_9]